jgi:hypothetical protein
LSSSLNNSLVVILQVIHLNMLDRRVFKERNAIAEEVCYIIAFELLWWTSPAARSGLLCKVDFNVVVSSKL